MKATMKGRSGRGKIAAAVAVIVALTAGFFAFAPSAFAHHPLVSGDSQCERDGTFTVNWTVGNSEAGSNRYMLVRAYSVTPDLGTTNGLTADASYNGIVGPGYSGAGTVVPPNGTVTATTSGIPGNTASITLAVTGRWEYIENNNTIEVTETRSFEVNLGGHCTPPTGSLSISKVVTGNTAPPGATFTINYDNGAGTSGQVNVEGGQTQTVTDLPYGSYTLSEVNAPAGATISPNPAVVGPNSPQVDITVTNPYPNVGSFSVKKQVTGETGGYVAGSQFVVGYSCTNGPSGSLTLVNGETKSVGNVPVGSTCTLSESSKPATSGPSYVYGPESWDPSNVITIGGTSNVAVVLTNPIERISGGFSVTKQVVGETGGYVPGSQFTVSYECTDGTSGSLVLANEDTKGVGGLPIGTSCTLAETAKPATTGPSYVYGPEVFSPSNVVTIVANDDDNVVQVTLNNPLEQLLGAFSVTKHVTGATGGYVADSTFTVSYDCTNGTEGVLTLTDGETKTVNDLPVGATCTLSETTKPATTGPSYVYGDEVFTPSSTVVIGSTDTVSVTLTNPIERRLGGLTVTKNVTGATEGYVADSTFGFTLDCAGAEFDQSFSLEAGATKAINGIPLGTQCTVEEVSVPEPVEGYEYQTPVLTPANGTVTINSTTVPVTITVENPLVWLPAPEASIADDCESGGAVVTLRNTGGGDVVYQIIVDGENFGPTHTVGSGGEEVVTVPLGEDQTATITVEADGEEVVAEEVITHDCQNPAVTSAVQCAEGGVVVTLTNDGDSPVELVVLKDGQVVATVEVGDTPVDVTVPMTEDQTSTITVKDGETTVFEQETTYDCVPPATIPPASVTTFEVLGSTETPLPVTGSNVFGLVILASGLILAGASLIGMTRRRS